MKLFFGEFPADYQKYYFPYQVWLLKETGDEVGKIYDSGFLPIRSIPGVYYLSRSLRVDLNKFEPSSENRRILKKTEGFDSKLIPLKQFSYSFAVQKFCKDYMVNKFGKGSMTAAGLRKIFKSDIYNSIFVWVEKETAKEVGYAVCFVNEDLLQYGHAFYDLNFFKQSIGARMMLEAVNWAKESGIKWAYLGTVYEEGSLYKTEYKGVEFFNGLRWSDNLEELKELVKRGSEKERKYLLRDKDYLEKYYPGNLSTILRDFGVKVFF